MGNATCSLNRLQSEGNPFGNVAQLSLWHSPNPSMQPLLQRKYPAINENNVWLGYQTNVFAVWYSLICLVLFGVLGCSGMFFLCVLWLFRQPAVLRNNKNKTLREYLAWGSNVDYILVLHQLFFVSFGRVVLEILCVWSQLLLCMWDQGSTFWLSPRGANLDWRAQKVGMHHPTHGCIAFSEGMPR